MQRHRPPGYGGGNRRRPSPARNAVNKALSALGKIGEAVKQALQRAPRRQQEAAYNDIASELGETPDPPERQRPADRQPPEQNPTHVVVRVGGERRRYKITDPIWTGKMIPVESSNVHSIGFRFQQNTAQSTLLVRYLDKRDGTAKPGSLYAYDMIHPDMFQQFQRAISKGIFVWDELRVRGTISGHQYPYRLIGIAGGYVPRQAVNIEGEEYYVGRTFRGQNNRTGRVTTRQSSLANQRAVPFRGAPNRGTPNRGN